MLYDFMGKTPQVSPEAFVAENASLIGEVTVEKDASVWFGAVLRGDAAAITVGPETSVQDNVVMHCESGHPMTIGKNVTIGHGAVVHCTSVGDNTIVGMGAILLDGAVIGKNCVIGAGAVVREHDVIPDGTMMVGVPAKPVRRIPEDRQEKMAGVSPYVALSKAYMK